MTMPTPFQSGPRLVDGDALNKNFAYPLSAFKGSITALAGGGRAGSPVLTEILSQVDTTASNNDSVQLPAAMPGMEGALANAGASTLKVYANGSDTINGTAGATGVTMTTGQNALLFCAEKGKWRAIIV